VSSIAFVDAAIAPEPISAGFVHATTFILHSQNKIDGTRKFEEHRCDSIVVGAGNANT